ncbi:hypothetical protein IFM89_018615 [Coptis chinensis]|uniref:Uncharacterized protein n=1 Tax=Coptis chinensis TaxID=261450 RepID=A0A835LIG9_9MAGN|nr:hypothetical protein IFM89_018615 [Coptis chinensis]
MKDITLNYPKESGRENRCFQSGKSLAFRFGVENMYVFQTADTGLFFLEARLVDFRFGKKLSGLKNIHDRGMTDSQRKLTYGKFGEWRSTRDRIFAGPPPRNFVLATTEFGECGMPYA